MIMLVDIHISIDKYTKKNKYFREKGIELRHADLRNMGDYSAFANGSVSILSRGSIQELISDINGKSRVEFNKACVEAKAMGVQLVVLVENKVTVNGGEVNGESGGIKCLEDLYLWENPRLLVKKAGKQKYPTAKNGKDIADWCYEMQEKYGVRFEFCTPEEAGERIVELLDKQ